MLTSDWFTQLSRGLNYTNFWNKYSLAFNKNKADWFSDLVNLLGTYGRKKIGAPVPVECMRNPDNKQY